MKAIGLFLVWCGLYYIFIATLLFMTWYLRSLSVAIIVIAITVARSASASDFAPFFVLDELPDVAVLNGEIDQRSALTFRRLLTAHPSVDTLVLNSGGGNSFPALMIAEEVYEKGISTFIFEEHECYSACAYIYLAGKKRRAAGKLGVHQFASGVGSEETAQIVVADLISSLTKFGTHPEVISKMLRTPHDDMHIFSSVEIENFSINRDDHTGIVNSSQPEPPSDILPKKRASLYDFLLQIIEIHEKSDRRALKYLSDKYFKNVFYYGKERILQDVLNDKKNYFSRWPHRRYKVRSDTVNIQCRGKEICSITGIYDWSVRSIFRNDRRNGSATFEYYVTYDAPFFIISEDGEVLK